MAVTLPPNSQFQWEEFVRELLTDAELSNDVGDLEHVFAQGFGKAVTQHYCIPTCITHRNKEEGFLHLVHKGFVQGNTLFEKFCFSLGCVSRSFATTSQYSLYIFRVYVARQPGKAVNVCCTTVLPMYSFVSSNPLDMLIVQKGFVVTLIFLGTQS